MDVLLEDSEVSQDPPEDDEDNDAGASASAGQFPRPVASGDASQELAHLAFSRPIGGLTDEMHDSFRGALGLLLQGVRGSSVTAAELHCEPRPEGRV
jgi:hypothetical protein